MQRSARTEAGLQSVEGGHDERRSQHVRVDRVYEAAFAEVGHQPEAWHNVDDKVALRFPDPDERRDAAGRVIPHDFVLLGHWADGINSLEDGRRRIWHEVADEVESAWDTTEPPSTRV